MYDGPTSDEANFIGYGFSNIGRAGATVYGTSENGDTDWSEELGRVYTEITSFTQGGTVTEKNGIPVIVKEDTSGAGASVIFNGFDFYTYPE
jgi:general stress protein YciG